MFLRVFAVFPGRCQAYHTHTQEREDAAVTFLSVPLGFVDRVEKRGMARYAISALQVAEPAGWWKGCGDEAKTKRTNPSEWV